MRALVSVAFKKALNETGHVCATYGRVIFEEGTVTGASGVFAAAVDVLTLPADRLCRRGRREVVGGQDEERLRGVGRRGPLRTLNLPSVPQVEWRRECRGYRE